jgi:hypothetical protein
MTIVTTDLLLSTSQALLQGSTAAGNRVYVPGDWSTWDKSYPYIRIRPGAEDRTSQGNSGINFDVVSVIRFTARVSAPAQANDGGAAAAEAALWALKRQIEIAIINAPQLRTALISDYPYTHAEVEVSSEGREHYAELVMDIAMAFYQGAEAFCQPPTVPLDGIDVTQTGSSKGPGLTVTFPEEE